MYLRNTMKLILTITLVMDDAIAADEIFTLLCNFDDVDFDKYFD